MDTTRSADAGMKTGTKRAWAIVIGLGIIHGFGMGTVMSGAGNFVVPVTTEMGFAASEFTLWTTFFGVFAAVAQFSYAGRLWQKYDSRIVLTGAFAVVAVAFALMGTYSQLWQWWLSGALIGLGGGVYFTMSKQLIAPNWFAKNSGFAIGVAQFIGLAIAAGFSPIQAMMIQAIGWRMAYPVIAVVCAVFVLPFALFVIRFSPSQLGLKPAGWEPGQVQTDSGAENAPGMVSKKAVVTFVFVALFLCSGLNSLFGGFKTLYGTAAASWGYDAMFAATMISVASLGAAILNPIMSFIIDKLGPFKGGYLCLGLIVLSCLGFIGLNGAAAAVMIAVFVYEVQSPLLATAIPLAIRKSFGPRDYPKIFSYTAIGMSFIGAFSSPIVALIFETTGSFNGSFMFAIGCAVLIAVLLGYVAARHKNLVWDYPEDANAEAPAQKAA